MNRIPVDHGARAGGPPRLYEIALRRPIAVLIALSVGEASVARCPDIAHCASGKASVASVAREASVSGCAGVVAGLHAEGGTGVVIIVVVI